MMEGCTTGIQSNNILLDTHFPGSTQYDEESLHPIYPEQVIGGDTLNDRYNIFLDKYLDDLSFLDPLRVKEAFNDMN